MPENLPSSQNALTFRPYGAPKALSFENVTELNEWVERELAQWTPFYELCQNYHFDHGRILYSMREKIRLDSFLRADFSVYADDINNIEGPGYLSYDAGGVSVLFEYVLRGDQAAAANIFLFLTGKPIEINYQANNINFTPLLRAATQWRDGAGYADAQMALVRNDTFDYLKKWRRGFLKLEETAENFVQQASSRDAALVDLHSQNKQKLETLHNDWDAALAETKRTYTEFMRLKAPADYWIEKASTHRRLSKIWLSSLLFLITVALFSTLIVYPIFMYSWIDHFSKPNAGAVGAVLLGLPVLLYLSLVKVAHKSYRDQARFAADAEQRTTLVQTYLALVHENDGGVQGGARLLALHALFRGSAQADGPDDTPPINTLEALVQGLKSKGAG